MIPFVRNRGRCFHDQDLLQTIGRHKKKRGPMAGVYAYILSARACSMRDVQAIEAALGDYVISERPLTENEWAAERAIE